MFDGGLPGVLVSVVDPHGKDDDFHVGVREGLFADLQEVVTVGSGVAVELDL